MRRRLAPVAATLLLGAAMPSVTEGALSWTLAASPQTVPVNVATTFTLTATNHDLVGFLGCVEIDVASSFVILSAGDPAASNGSDWTATVVGQRVTAASGPSGRLAAEESVTFTIAARPTAAGSWSWPNHAHVSSECSGGEEPGTPITVSVVAPNTPTPAPTPSPAPTPPPAAVTPAPTAAVTPAPTPVRTLQSRPTATPTARPAARQSAPAAPAAASPTEAGDPEEPSGGGVAAASAAPSVRPSPGSPGEPASAPDPASESPVIGSPSVQVRAPVSDELGEGLRLGIEVLALLEGAHVWFVPAAAIGVPGLLVLIWVALQALGVLVWIPAVRRMSNDDSRRRRVGAIS